MSDNYLRVIPRDLFNESKLLKCVGFIVLEYENKMFPDNVEIIYDGKPFNIQQDCDGNIEIVNLVLRKDGDDVRLYHPLNNKNSYPLRAEFFAGENVRVFDNDGLFTKEFEDLLNI